MAMMKMQRIKINQKPNLNDYELAWDSERRKRMKPLRFRDKSNMVACAFFAAEEKDTHEPLTYHEAVAYEDSPKWKAAIKEDMGSLRKNKTWELVHHLARQKLVIPALTAGKDCELEQLNVKMTFLHGNLKEPPRQWYKRLNEYMLSNGFKRSNYDSCVCYMSYALAKTILGMEIVRDRSRKILRVSQSGYISKILNKFTIDNEKSVKMPLGRHFKPSLKNCSVREYVTVRLSKVPYANSVRSLMYLTVCTTPDIVYPVKWIWKYLRSIVNVRLVYAINSDYGNDLDKGRFITCYAFLVHGCVVSWKATLQHVVTLSTKEDEYMALTEAVNEAIWLRGLLEELGVELNTVVVNCDIQGAIHLS
uniref:Retrovirus-related Pol polyprotein from transposon TNT 1-94 n=1 Tax=Tanacetum cinerariifolium TaxID=118510 RepID=A0A6L2L5I9_TANCI|nr:hypothetical protein [Tanacetum cinerariifolium]